MSNNQSAQCMVFSERISTACQKIFQFIQSKRFEYSVGEHQRWINNVLSNLTKKDAFALQFLAFVMVGALSNN